MSSLMELISILTMYSCNKKIAVLTNYSGRGEGFLGYANESSLFIGFQETVIVIASLFAVRTVKRKNLCGRPVSILAVGAYSDFCSIR